MPILDVEQITLTELLEDKIFRSYFLKEPYLQPPQRTGKPWWVYIQFTQEGPWKRAQASSYKAAFTYAKKKLHTAHDISITSRRREFPPPSFRPVRANGRRAKNKVYWSDYPSSHHWCPYCRRPTVFAYFVNHPAIDPIHSAFGITSTPQDRCSICGIRAEAVRPWMNLGR